MDHVESTLLSYYVSPGSLSPLTVTSHGLVGEHDHFDFLPSFDTPIPDFRESPSHSAANDTSSSMYDSKNARAIYRNFLSWMFRTFDVHEDEFRRNLIDRLHLTQDSTVLITGCGLGDDVVVVREMLGPGGRVFASDLSPEMVAATLETLSTDELTTGPMISLSVSDACSLPFEDCFFDAAFHFGGINLFGDVEAAIVEMSRVTKDGGRVVFGDEGVAPWLSDTDYGKMVIANNPLWAAEAPIGLLPRAAINPSISWILGNCFYLIEFEKDSRGPFINPDIPHIGRRGGSMRKRYLGQIEGVSPSLKSRVLSAANENNVSVTDWLEKAISEALDE